MRKIALAIIITTINLWSCDTPTEKQIVEQELRLKNLKGFRKYILGSPTSNYPQLKENNPSVPKPYVNFGEMQVKEHSLFNDNENLNFGDLNAENIRFYSILNKLYKIEIEVDSSQILEFVDTLEKLYCSPIKHSPAFDINNPRRFKISNSFLEITIDDNKTTDKLWKYILEKNGALDNYTIIYKSLEIENELNYKDKTLQSKLIKERLKSF